MAAESFTALALAAGVVKRERPRKKVDPVKKKRNKIQANSRRKNR